MNHMSVTIPRRAGTTMKDPYRALKELVQVTRDSQELYDAVADSSGNPELAQLCRRFAAAKGELIEALKLELVSLGGPVPADGTLMGELRRAFTSLRASLSTHADVIRSAELEQSEDRLLQAYERALDDLRAPQLRAILTLQMPRVRQCHEEMRRMKEDLGDVTPK
jgi:uncharacterized protein (TIGR02284 family)